MIHVFFAYALFFSKNTFSALLPKKSENSSQSVGEKQRSGLDVRENESNVNIAEAKKK